jgi:opacity protein-like surface antigen
MKKIGLAIAVLAAFTGSVVAADMTPGGYTKAPPRTIAANWTGFYLFGGAGGGLWAADNNVVLQSTGLPVTRDQRLGGSGWYGTFGAGYDWQVNSGWLIGVLADGQFGSIRGSIADRTFEGAEKLRTSYAAGIRLGYLVAPNVCPMLTLAIRVRSGRVQQLPRPLLPLVVRFLRRPPFIVTGSSWAAVWKTTSISLVFRRPAGS